VDRFVVIIAVQVYPLYHAPLVFTFAGSLEIFELKQLKKIVVLEDC
jgi:hypothetical protein